MNESSLMTSPTTYAFRYLCLSIWIDHLAALCSLSGVLVSRTTLKKRARILSFTTGSISNYFQYPQQCLRPRVCSVSARRRLVRQSRVSCLCKNANKMLLATAVAHCKVAFTHLVAKRPSQLTTILSGWKRSRQSEWQTSRPHATRNSSLQGTLSLSSIYQSTFL